MHEVIDQRHGQVRRNAWSQFPQDFPSTASRNQSQFPGHSELRFLNRNSRPVKASSVFPSQCDNVNLFTIARSRRITTSSSFPLTRQKTAHPEGHRRSPMASKESFPPNTAVIQTIRVKTTVPRSGCSNRRSNRLSGQASPSIPARQYDTPIASVPALRLDQNENRTVMILPLVRT